ncbi:hypothetical protein SP5_110_00070 [Sphingomonas parapaucimobilis NBRC 15100]|uniref:Uncharacterized protein n=1 Tax=Sphingomonas parapaucimobilis NBRC 15100 TaxID=1219049 RepID=A0A0A1WDG9_9SPHN|nr:hypothetical protein SP5_110_00070 [Sphingomonas parapaucimobilis NBRC 15100]
MFGMRAANLRCWVLGYDRDAKHEAPLWRPRHGLEDDDGVLLSF